jgi:hypothetical protein
MSPTVIRIFLTLLLCVVLTISIYVMRFNVVGSVIAGVVFVVLVLGVWMVRSVGGDISKKVARTSPRQLLTDTRKLVGALARTFNDSELERIGDDTQDLIVVTLEQVQKGQVKSAKKAAATMKTVSAKGLKNLKDEGVIASTLTKYYLLADSYKESDEADDAKSLIDNFIAGIHDADL